ncbi:MAG: CoA-binding protein, partial [Pseudomonadota bacterium]
MTTLDHLLTPRSVAVIGASDDPTRIGGRPLNYFLNHGFQGEIYPVNPKREVVQGTRAYPTLTDIPGEVDFALVAVPAPLVNDVIREAVAKKVKTVMIFSSGFAETNDQGAAWQAEMPEIIEGSQTRIIGPNCLGVY